MINNKFYVIIPVRLESSRLPQKAIADINGMTMLERTWRQASLSSARKVIIATDSETLVQLANSFGATVCLTKKQHLSGTARIQEACSIYNLKLDDIIVNVQVDEPMIQPTTIDTVANALITKTTDIATLKTKINNLTDYQDTNQVKVVTDVNNYALYFSRSPIPWNKNNQPDKLSVTAITTDIYKHIGIYAYTVESLNKFVALPISTLEKIESLEQLRFLVNGYKIYTKLVTNDTSIGVDTPTDLAKVRKILAKNTC